MADANVIEVSEATFEQEVVKSEILVVVDFWAPWCGPCKMISPLLDEIAAELGGKVRIAKVNVDDNQGLATKFHISAVPTLLIFKGGQQCDKVMGAAGGKKALLQKISACLDQV